MSTTIHPKMADDKTLAKLYSTRWRAYFKRGLGQPTIVYGENEEIALRNALAYIRKINDSLALWPRERVVDHVECIG